ncbi:MAG TPA: biopolymer transporter ExbD [Verrucomicrobiae bacterium]|jgi:biopolymer transport protein ExbD
MKKTSASHHSTMNELNITPLLDLVFVLLVIFIITTPQMMNNLEINLPSGKTPPQKEKPRINNIGVDAGGQITLNNQIVTIAQLKENLQQIQASSADPDINVVVSGDDNVNYQSMISVIDVLQQLNISKMGLATQSP